jgi:hypothetical protein
MTDEQILHLQEINVGGPSPSYPLDNADWINFARAIEAAASAPLIERIAQKQARIDQLIQEVAAGADVEAKQRGRIAELEAKLAQQAEAQEPIGYMNAGHIYELQQKRIHYGYVYPKEGTGAEIAVFTRPQPAQLQRLSEEEAVAAWRGVDDAGDDRRNAMLYGDAIQSALAAKNGAELK